MPGMAVPWQRNPLVPEQERAIEIAGKTTGNARRAHKNCYKEQQIMLSSLRRESKGPPKAGRPYPARLL
jgi:hypothetical protein